jgi:hypothetical protein
MRPRPKVHVLLHCRNQQDPAVSSGAGQAGPGVGVAGMVNLNIAHVQRQQPSQPTQPLYHVHREFEIGINACAITRSWRGAGTSEGWEKGQMTDTEQVRRGW